MFIHQSIRNVFQQLGDSVSQLSDQAYRQPCSILQQATVGQHLRHVIELFICLYKGYDYGIVNYDKRDRDIRIETDRPFALYQLQQIVGCLERPDKELFLETLAGNDTEEPVLVRSNYYREIIYNLEHTVHHMALIRIGLSEVSAIQVPNEFGVASSTLKYRQACAQ